MGYHASCICAHILGRKCISLLSFLSKSINKNFSTVSIQLWQVSFAHQGVSVRPRRNMFSSWVAEEAGLEGNHGNGDKKLPVSVSLTLKADTVLSSVSPSLLNKLGELAFFLWMSGLREERRQSFHIKLPNSFFYGKLYAKSSGLLSSSVGAGYCPPQITPLWWPSEGLGSSYPPLLKGEEGGEELLWKSLKNWRCALCLFLEFWYFSGSEAFFLFS